MSLRKVCHVLVSSVTLLAAYETASAAPPPRAGSSIRAGRYSWSAGGCRWCSGCSVAERRGHAVSRAERHAVAPTAPPAAAPAAPPVTPPALDGVAHGHGKGGVRSRAHSVRRRGLRWRAREVRSAYDMSKDPRLLWNMAACQKNLRHYAEVVRLVDRYLGEGRGYVSDSDRSDATSLLDTVKDFISRVDVTSNEPGAAVFIDDVSVGTTPLGAALPVDMGSHKVRVSKAGFVDFATTVELPGGRPFQHCG